MELNYQDKGNYFRGLLILIGKDKIIAPSERNTILQLCKKLGFDSKFCKDSVNDFLENEFISHMPPRFSTDKIAEKFLEDAIKLSFVDNDFHIEELEWLEKVALENNIDKFWLDKKLQMYLKMADFQDKNQLQKTEINITL